MATKVKKSNRRVNKALSVDEACYRAIMEERLEKINECFLNLGPDPDQNINRLVNLCGRLLKGACALYNRLEGGMLYSVGKWNTPSDFNPLSEPQGHICYDVIMRKSAEPFIVRNLQKSLYSKTDPNVSRYKLKTYVGLAVKFDNTYIGSLCVVFQKDVLLSEQEIKFMTIIASAIGVEENRRQSRQALEQSQDRYKHITETVTDYLFTVYLKDGQVVETVYGPTCVSVTGYTAEEFVSESQLWIRIVYEEDKPALLKHISNILSGKRAAPVEHRIIRKDGVVRWVRNTTVSHFDAQGTLMHYDGLIQDITERKEVEEAIRKSEERYRTLYESSKDGIVFTDLEGKIIDANQAYLDMLGYPGEEIVNLTYQQMTPAKWHEFEADIVKNQVIARGYSDEYEKEYVRKDGKLITISIRVWLLKDTGAQPVGMWGIVRDISERKLAQKQLESLNEDLVRSNKRLKQLVLRDPHTGLYNHRYLEDVIEMEFYRSRRYAHPLSAVMLDTDYFKSINDVYGYKFGDLILKQLARQLKMMVRRYDILVRFGGEEFVIICPYTDREQALILAQRLLDAVNLYNFGDAKHIVKLKLSLAAVSYPEDNAAKGMDLVDLASEILNKAKESGGNRVYSCLDIKNKKPQELFKNGKNENVRLLKGKLDKLTKRSNQSLIEAIFAFSKTIELKDHYTGEHVEKTVHYATEIARTLGLTKDEIESIRQAAMLHDLGKIGISEKILLKRSKLTKEEFEVIKKHPQIGVDIIRPIQFLHKLIPFMLYHHERWDGKGYPGGLKGEEIPMGARIVAIADVYQALTSDRPYRKAYSKDKALSIIKSGSGAQFDPRIAQAFLKIIEKNNNR